MCDTSRTLHDPQPTPNAWRRSVLWFRAAFRRVASATPVALTAALTLACAAPAGAAGTLTPVGATEQPIAIRDHQVRILINNGFAQTEVTQTFFNPNAVALEAIYSFPIPRSASLSEVSITTGETELQGEVLPKADAERIYEEEKSQGNDAGLATKNSYQTFEFRVSRVLPDSEVRLRFLYYQPLEIDTGVGRYLYPLESGGTDEIAANFWTANEHVEGQLTIDVELKSAVAIDELRTPGFESAAVTTKLAPGHHTVHIEASGASLDRDFVLYYRLPSDLPGRVEVIPYRADAAKPGTFMLVVTPGIDLQPITAGADYCFVLDVSGSMQGKIKTLAHGVSKALGTLRPEDRFRIVTFSSAARELCPWQAATVESVQSALRTLEGLTPQNSTNLFDGIKLGLASLDSDRATSVVLVTDGVTNTGIIDPKAFRALLEKHDVRFFGFLMGNSANWPLMKLICDTTGGFYAGISNEDDIIGQLLLAKSKITHECLHDASLAIRGVKTLDCSDELLGKVYRGQQLVLFGKYAQGGLATLTLQARLTGEDKTYTTTFNFPELETDNPEIERLAALNRIEQIELKEQAGLMPPSESSSAIESIGVEYQLVTDHTSMVVLSDDTHARHGIERRNRERTATEHDAQTRRAAQPIRNWRVDEAQPMFNNAAPAVHGNGGGAIDPLTGGVLLGFGVIALVIARRARRGASVRDGDRAA